MEEGKLPALEAAEPQPPKPERVSARSGDEKRLILYVVLAAVIVLALVIGSIVLMAQHPEGTAVVRDIAIVFVALTTLFIGLAMLVLIIQLAILVKVLRDEVTPLMQSLQETLATVRGTTAFVSESVVSPVVKVAGFAAAVKRVASDVVGVVGAIKHGKPKSSTGGKNDGQE